MTFGEVASQAIGPFGAMVVLLFVVIAFIREDIVPGGRLKKEEARNERLEAIAMKGVLTSDLAADLARSILEKARDEQRRAYRDEPPRRPDYEADR